MERKREKKGAEREGKRRKERKSTGLCSKIWIQEVTPLLGS